MYLDLVLNSVKSQALVGLTQNALEVAGKTPSHFRALWTKPQGCRAVTHELRARVARRVRAPGAIPGSIPGARVPSRRLPRRGRQGAPPAQPWHGAAPAGAPINGARTGIVH